MTTLTLQKQWPTDMTDARILSHRGYAIRKDALTAAETRKLRAALTVMPAIPAEFSKGMDPFPIYYESPTRWYVPRYWGLEHCGEPDADVRQPGLSLPSSLAFTLQLRPNQVEIVNAFRAAGDNGIISVPCGYGKTFMAIWLAIAIGRRFLVVVHQEFFLEQWRKELEAAVPGIRVGKLQGSTAELDPTRYDVTICMLQTLCSRDWPLDTFNGYGFTIFDECHHLGAEHFSKALMSIQTLKMLGLSATPDRQDGLSNVFLWYLGPIRYQIRIRDPDETVEVRILRFHSADPAYADEPTDCRGEVSRPRLCNQLAEHTPRTLAIVEELLPLVAEGRQILVLSDRRGHLGAFEDAFAERGYTDVGYYVGGMKQKDRDESATKQIVLATFTLSSEGLNIKTLSAVALVTPKSNIEQSVGRIFRLKKEERKFHPVIFDVEDVHDCLRGQLQKRLKFYRQCAYQVRFKKDHRGYISWKETQEATAAAAAVAVSGPLFKS